MLQRRIFEEVSQAIRRAAVNAGKNTNLISSPLDKKADVPKHMRRLRGLSEENITSPRAEVYFQTIKQTPCGEKTNKKGRKKMKKHAFARMLVIGMLALSLAVPNVVSAKHNESADDYSVGANKYRTHTVRVRKGETLNVHVEGSGNSKLAVYVFDHHGEEMTHDDEGGNECHCSFVAPRTETYSIRVKNLDHHSTRYTIETSTE
jgi:hypothetical protein